MSNPYMTSPPARRTNGLAIASFVLSLVWLAGLGSLLAVIFGTTAGRDIRRSQGAQSDGGLATAGLVIGILGLLGAAVFWVGVVAVGAGLHKGVSQLQPHTTTVHAGQAVTLSPVDEGINNVTVFTVVEPVASSSAYLVPDTGKEFAVADVQLCAGQDGSPGGPGGLFMHLVLAGGTNIDAGLDAKTPALSNAGAIPANQCVRGYVTFEIPSGATPAAVTYNPDPFRTYRWILVG